MTENDAQAPRAQPDGREVCVGEGPRAFVRAWGESLGRELHAGDVVALVGPLGAGKTFLARAIATGAGVPEGVRMASPTFNLVQQYEGRFPVYHADLYRLTSPAEFADLGLIETAANGLLIVEWADRFEEAMPAVTTWVRLERTAPLRRRIYMRRPDASARGTLDP